MPGGKTAFCKKGWSPPPQDPQMRHSDPTTARKNTGRAQQFRRSHGGSVGTSKLHVGSGLKTTHRTCSLYVPLAASSSSRHWVQSINTTARQLAASSQSPFIPLSSHFRQREALDEGVNWRWGTYSHGRCSETRGCPHSVGETPARATPASRLNLGRRHRCRRAALLPAKIRGR